MAKRKSTSSADREFHDRVCGCGSYPHCGILDMLPFTAERLHLYAVAPDILEAGQLLADELAEYVNADESERPATTDAFAAWQTAISKVE